MGREYSSDLSGLRDELINGLAALRKEVQKESEKVGRAIGDGYEDGYEDSVEVVRKSKEDLLQELQDLQGAFERNLNKLPTILKKSFQKLDFADLSRVSRRLKTEISEIQNIYGDLSKIGVDININGWMDLMLQKANQLSVSLDQQSEIVSDIGKAAEDAANKVKKSAKELSNTIEKTNNSLDNSKTIKSIDDLEKKYFSIIGTVEKYLQLVEKLNKVSGNNSRDLRKQVINFANEMPQDVAGMLGEKFVQQLANGFKGISTKDIIKAITSPSNANAFGALQHKLNLAKSIDFNNIKYTDDGSIKLSDSDNPFEFLKSIEGQLPIVNELYEVLDNIATAKKELGTSGTIEAMRQQTAAIQQQAKATEQFAKAQEKSLDTIARINKSDLYRRGETYYGKSGRLKAAGLLGSEAFNFNLTKEELVSLAEFTYEHFSKVRNVLVDLESWTKAFLGGFNESRFAEKFNELFPTNVFNKLRPLEEFQAVVQQVKDGLLEIPEALNQISIMAKPITDAVQQQEQLAATVEKTAQVTQDSTATHEKNAAAIQQEAKKTEQLAKAQKKASGVKVREFTREEYDAYTEQYQKDHDGDNEFLENTVDIIREASQFGTQFAVDMETSCKRAATAVNRFFSAIDQSKYPALAGWKDTILESVQNGVFSEKEMYNGMFTGAYSWGVEAPDDDRYYVYLNLLDVAKDKEKEYGEYYMEECRKRDEALQKEGKLLYELVQKYKELSELHRNEPDWYGENSSIQEKLAYYEQEKILLQDIANIRKEVLETPGKYRSTGLNEHLNNLRQGLYLGEHGNSTLNDNERITATYQKELERVIQKQQQLTATTQETVQTREQEVIEQEKLVATSKNIVQLIDNYGAKLDDVNNKLMQGTTLLNKQAQVLRLFHNSSNVFDAFDSTKAGSNQGQALGFGHYLALQQNGEFNNTDYGRYQTQWYANVQNAFKVGDKISSDQAASIIDKFLVDRAEGFKQHMLSKLLDGDVVNAVKDIADESKTVVGEIFSHIGYDAIMDGAQINVFDPSKIYRANDSVLDISTKEFAALEELQKKIWEEQKIIEKANSQIKELSNQYIGKTEEELDFSLFMEVLSKGYGWRQNVAKIASAFKELTGKLPKSDDISEESMQAIVENYEFSRQNLQEYQAAVEKHRAVVNELVTQFDSQKAVIDTITQSYLTGDIKGIVNAETQTESIASATQQQGQFQKKIEETTSDIEKQNKELGKTADIIKSVFDGYKSPFSDVEMKQLLKGANLNNILSGLNISKANKAEITNKYNQLASMWADEGKVEESALYAAIQEFVDSVVKSSTRRIENVTQDIKDKAQEFLNYMNGKQFSYSAADRAEFGSDWAAASKVALGKNQKLLSNKSGTPLTGSRYTEILDVYNKLIGAAQEIDQKQNQLQQIVKMVSNAKNLAGAPLTKSIDLTAEDSAALYDKVSASMSVASNNAEQMRIVAAEAVKKEEELAAAAERVAEAKRKQSESAKKAKQEISVESIIERDIEKALGQLRSAKDNETTLINLKGVFSGDDLVEQFSSMVQKIAEQANLSVGKITVKDDIAQVRLYNEELKVTVEQMYKLRQATEEADSAQLELVSQSFSQNVKALNENTFDVDGFRARAVAAVEKVRSSLHGLEYDLTDLEKSAGNISSKEDFAKFNNQLKAAQDNIQAIKNATVSKSSMNQLANMQRDMKNANIELETMRIKLQKIGDIDGVEDAKKMIDDMALAAQKFNEAQDAQGQQDAYSKYSASRSSFKAQLEYLNAVKSFNASQASAAKQTVDPIKNQYNSILDTVNKINSINSDILKFQEKDAGSGLYSSYIKQLQAGKEQLVAQLQSTVQEIDAALSEGFVRGKEISIPSVKFLGNNEAVSNFLNSTKTQAALTADEIDRLVVSLQKAQSIDVQAAARVVEQFRTVQETYQKIGSLFSLDTNSTMYKNVEILFSSITKYRRMLSSDPTEWTPEQSKYLQTLIDEFNRYGNTLVQVGQKEQQYFAGKQKYTADTSMQSMAEDAKKSAEEVSAAQQKLTTAAQNFAKESGASGAIVTNFVQGADGISRLDFSVLDSGTNSLRKFRMEMGSVSEGTYITETTVNNFVSKTQQAAKQLQTVSDLISRLQLSGANMDNSSVVRLVSSQQKLAAELSKGSGADQNVLSQLTKDAKLSAAEVEKLYKQFVQLNNLVTSNESFDLGKINFGENVREQLKNSLAAWGKQNEFTNIKLSSLNEVTGKFKVTAQATDNTVREFTGSLNQLGNSASMQQTKVTELGSKWDRFKTSLAKTGRQLMVALVGYNVFFKAISEIRKGIGYVKDIDLAMTELRKVTDETEASYSRFLKTASKTAGVIGSTVSDFTDATANFARLGLVIKLAPLYSNI